MNTPVRILSILAAAALAGTAFPAFAEQVTLRAVLSGAEEVPSNASPGTGVVDASYDSETNAFSYTVTYEGLSGDPTAAHFHGPAAPGENAPPVLPVEGALTSPIAGSATLTDAEEAELLSGMWYFNLHTAQYPDGELRGQMYQSAMSSESSMMSSEDNAMSSEMPSSQMSSEMSSEPCDISSVSSISCEVSVSVDPSSVISSVSSEVSSAVSSVSSEVSSVVSSVSSEVSSAVSSVSSELSSVDPSVSASGEVSGEVSVSP